MKTAEKSAIVIFEFTDEKRTINSSVDYTSESTYFKLFMDFIESLGFEVTQKYTGINNDVSINGIDRFKIDTSSASYSTNSAWKGRGIRKEENRHIKLSERGYNGKTVIKITFNKEYDANKLRDKINASIKAEVDREKKIIERKEQDKINTIATAENYILNNPNFNCVPVSNIIIHEGKIKFYIDNCGCYEIMANGDFVNFHLDSADAKTREEVSLLFSYTRRVQEYVINMQCAMIQRLLTQELQDWTKTAYNKTFHVKEMKYSEC